jgi:hypothetical protein
MMSRFFRRLGVMFKKKTLVARQQHRPDGESIGPRRSQAIGVHRRDPWVKPEGRVWTKTKMTGFAAGRRKESAWSTRFLSRRKTATFLAALGKDRIDAPCLFGEAGQ